MNNPPLPRLLAISGYSGTGKTTLLKQVIPLLKGKGVRVGVIKHTHHDMDIDIPGKDSYELRKAGAEQTLVASSRRWALMTETPHNDEVNLYDMIGKMDAGILDIVLVEGFRHEKVPKIALFRQAAHAHAVELLDEYVIAIATDTIINIATALPQLDINNPGNVADFIADWLQSNTDY